MGRRLRLVAGAGVLGLAAFGLIGCHVPADVACQRYAAPRHQVVQAYWSTQTDRYVCLSVHRDTRSRDRFYVYEVRRSDGSIAYVRHG